MTATLTHIIQQRKRPPPSPTIPQPLPGRRLLACSWCWKGPSIFVLAGSAPCGPFFVSVTWEHLRWRPYLEISAMHTTKRTRRWGQQQQQTNKLLLHTAWLLWAAVSQCFWIIYVYIRQHSGIHRSLQTIPPIMICFCRYWTLPSPNIRTLCASVLRPKVLFIYYYLWYY